MNDANYAKFLDQVEYRIKKNEVTFNLYELGLEAYSGARYPAVKVHEEAVLVGIGSFLSAGTAFTYGDSVAKGRKEFKAYTEQRMAKCKDALFVIGGYSQGAQVVREGIELLSQSQKDRIVYSALFGDPKLYLPEGWGLFPAACRGENHSPWRMDVPNCRTYVGSLEAQRPYVSSSLKYKTGLWCNDHDFVCGSAWWPEDREGHGKYANPGQAIDKAAKKIAERVKAKLPPAQAKLVDTKPKQGDSITGHDIAFVIDIHSSMASKLPQIKEHIRKTATDIASKNGRVGLIFFGSDNPRRDEHGEVIPGQSPASLASVGGMAFEHNIESKLQILDGVYADKPGKASPLHGMQVTLDVLNWRHGASKSLVLFTDQAVQSPDYNENTNMRILKRALEIDPVSIFPVVPEDSNEYAELADKSSGKVFETTSEDTQVKDDVFQTIMNRPVVLFKNTEYVAQSGQKIQFDVSESYVLNSEIATYEWDFDGDLQFEKKTTAPQASHSYATDGDRIVQVRMTAANGMVGNGSAIVKIGQPEMPAQPKAPTNVKVVTPSDKATSATLTWTPADTLADLWAISVNGVTIGLVPRDTHSIELRDLQRTEDITVSVAGRSADKTQGESSSVVLAKPAPAPEQSCNRNSFLSTLVCHISGWYKTLLPLIIKWIPAFR